MIKTIYLLFALVLFQFTLISAQDRTVGVFLNDSLAYDGYTLFSPGASDITYLIDNCGHEINKWEATASPGLTSYLLEDGSLLRTGRALGTFGAGGAGGLLEIYNWEGELTWSYQYGNSEEHQHHDVEPLPNGNILVIAWEGISEVEAIDNGRDTNLINSVGLWPDKIVEIQPIGTDGLVEVWEWRAWDHLIQEFDSTKPNYGVVADHDELIHLNYTSSNIWHDWMHTNSVEYIEERDEILISVKHHHEIWIIDHSTTLEESRSHSGGNRGKGGDLLFRWGNPQAYQKGGANDQALFGQHSARWLPPTDNDPGQIVVYNNGVGRGDYSSIDVVQPTIDDFGNYVTLADGTYGPEEVSWEYTADPPESLFNGNQGGVSVAPNGNFIISDTRNGAFIEVNRDKEVHWRYVSPVNFGLITQGDRPIANGVFRVERYGADYPGLIGKDLIPGDLIEVDPLPDDCTLYPLILSSSELNTLGDVYVYPNVSSSFFNVKNSSNRSLDMRLINAQGNILSSKTSTESNVVWPIQDLSPGIYFLQIMDESDHRYSIQKIVKI